MAAKRSRVTRAAAVVAAAALMGAGLSGCGGLGRALGISKSSPDEFAVVKKAPLVLPPDYELRPPKPGAKRPQELEPTEAAKQALFKNDFGQPTAAPTNTEQAVLTNSGGTQTGTGTAQAEPAVQKTTGENQFLVRKSEDFANKLMFTNQDAIKASADGDEKATITKDKN